jgi:hypothetical protein
MNVNSSDIAFATRVELFKIDRFQGQMTMFITVVFIEVWRINKKGRCFQNGKPISPNRRCNIIDEIKFKGGNKDTGIFMGSFVDLYSE